MELFFERFLFLDQVIEDEVRKRGSGVNRSIHKLFDVLAGRETSYSGRWLTSACHTIKYNIFRFQIPMLPYTYSLYFKLTVVDKC